MKYSLRTRMSGHCLERTLRALITCNAQLLGSLTHDDGYIKPGNNSVLLSISVSDARYHELKGLLPGLELDQSLSLRTS